jgi:transcriptional regulator with XRE-family HTH domain
MPRRKASRALARGIGARIRILRDEAAIKQEKLAWECGFSKSYLSQLEAGKTTPSLAALEVLARHLGTDLVAILAVDTRKALHRGIDILRGLDEKAATRLLAGSDARPQSGDGSK